MAPKKKNATVEPPAPEQVADPRVAAAGEIADDVGKAHEAMRANETEAAQLARENRGLYFRRKLWSKYEPARRDLPFLMEYQKVAAPVLAIARELGLLDSEIAPADASSMISSLTQGLPRAGLLFQGKLPRGDINVEEAELHQLLAWRGTLDRVESYLEGLKRLRATIQAKHAVAERMTPTMMPAPTVQRPAPVIESYGSPEIQFDPYNPRGERG